MGRRPVATATTRWAAIPLALVACDGRPAPEVPVVVALPHRAEPEPVPREPSPPAAKRCSIVGTELQGAVDLLLPDRDEVWASMRSHVTGRYRMTVPAVGTDRAELRIETEIVRIDGGARVSEFRLQATNALDFNPVVTSHVGHAFRWRPNREGDVRLELRLDEALRPAVLERDVACSELRLGGIDLVEPEIPDGFEEIAAVEGEGLIPLYADAHTDAAALRVDGARGILVRLGRTSGDRREILYRGGAFHVRAWVAKTRIVHEDGASAPWAR